MRLLAGLALVAVGLTGCGDDDTAGAPEDVIFENGATDESWVSFAEAEDMIDDTGAPELTAPTAPIPRATPATFTWTGGAVASSGPRVRARLRAELAELLLGPGVAHAHGTPYTGPLYRLIIDVPGSAPVRVLTGGTTYTPTAPVWDRITPATGPLAVEIAGAYCRLDRIEEGPYLRSTAAMVTFE